MEHDVGIGEHCPRAEGDQVRVPGTSAGEDDLPHRRWVGAVRPLLHSQCNGCSAARIAVAKQVDRFRTKQLPVGALLGITRRPLRGAGGGASVRSGP